VRRITGAWTEHRVMAHALACDVESAGSDSTRWAAPR